MSRRQLAYIIAATLAVVGAPALAAAGQSTNPMDQLKAVARDSEAAKKAKGDEAAKDGSGKGTDTSTRKPEGSSGGTKSGSSGKSGGSGSGGGQRYREPPSPPRHPDPPSAGSSFLARAFVGGLIGGAGAGAVAWGLDYQKNGVYQGPLVAPPAVIIAAEVGAAVGAVAFAVGPWLISPQIEQVASPGARSGRSRLKGFKAVLRW